MLAALVVAAVIGAVVFKRLIEARKQCVNIRFRCIQIEDQGTDLGAQEVIGAGCAKRAERLQFLRVDELQHGILIVEMTKLALVFPDASANFGHQPRSDCPAIFPGQGIGDSTAKNSLAFSLGSEPLDRPVDNRKRQLVTGLGIVVPGEETMAFQHNALGIGVCLDEGFKVETELEAGAAPRQPANLTAEHVFRQFP